MAITYFAYGSNMSPRIIENVCPSYKFIARACLIDYRLAFTRRSVRWEAGVANIISAPGMTVWGILFEIDDADLVSLDDKEAYGKAYDRITVQVDMKDYSESGTQKINAITYQVISPEQFEIRPHPDYLKMLIDGAGQFKLPLNYISFLKSLENEPMAAFRKGMLVFPSQDRQDARGSNIVVVDKKVAQEKELKDFVMVSYGHKFCLAKVSFLDSSKRRNDSENVCEMDQSIRQALGMPGRECYGANVSLHPANKGTPNYWIFQPRSLILQTYRSSTFDSEKNICVLHPHNIRLLGIEEGEYVKVFASVREDGNKYKIQSHSFRVFSGVADEITRDGIDREEYPRHDKVYIDLDGRLKLGIGKDDYDVPVIIKPSIRRLMMSRSLLYGVMLFLSIDAIILLFSEIGRIFNLNNSFQLGISIFIAVIIVLILCITDIRGKIQY